MTHAEVKGALQARGLTPIGEYDPFVCPGGNNLGALSALRRALMERYGIPFDETKFFSLFTAGAVGGGAGTSEAK
jgi:hypothetical protein